MRAAIWSHKGRKQRQSRPVPRRAQIGGKKSSITQYFGSCWPITNKWLLGVTSGHCRPSAADEEWYSQKRPSSTVSVNSSELNTKVSAFSLVCFVPARQNAFSCLFFAPFGELDALPLFTPFVRPDGSSHHYGGRFVHLGAVTTQGSLAKSFTVIVFTS